MSIERRIDKLERGNGNDEPSFVYVSWEDEDGIPDDAIITLSNGLKMSFAEVRRRYPETDSYSLIWSDNDEITLIKDE